MNTSIANHYSALLVDDDLELLRVIEQVLEDGGFSVVTARSGEEALNVLQSQPFDVIMTDIRMPGISGFELIEKIAAIDEAVKTVLMTGFDSSDTVKQALRTGAYDYLTKPLDDHGIIIQCANRAAQATNLIRDNAELLDQLRAKQTMLEHANEQLRRLNDELHVQANTDVLTQLYNRRFLDDTLQNQVFRRNRYADSLSVALIDVDHFKTINDEYGHAGGDIVLKAISAALSQCVRESDIVGRYGGEEFLVILPSTAPEFAMLFAERIRSRINAQEIVLGESVCPVAISIGVSGVEEDYAELNMTELVNSADKALYAAKKAGRNCIRLQSISGGNQGNLKLVSGL